MMAATAARTEDLFLLFVSLRFTEGTRPPVNKGRVPTSYSVILCLVYERGLASTANGRERHLVEGSSAKEQKLIEG